jgi:hypothetical protein
MLHCGGLRRHVRYGVIKLPSIWIVSPLWCTMCGTKVQQPERPWPTARDR